MKTKKLFFMIIAMLYTIFCVFSQQYKFGDEGPGGGIVFYYSEEGFDVNEADGSIKRCNYLEVSKNEVACVSWCPCNNSDCCINTNGGLGFGKINTYKIINAKHEENVVSYSNCAAKACAEYSTAQTSKGEWFLPSRDELNILYKNYGYRIWLTNQDYICLWSSSNGKVNGRYIFLYQNFKDGRLDATYSRESSHSVYAVRAF